MPAKRILVVGAGLGGLAAALALLRKGFDVRVLEQVEEPGEIGAGVQLSPNAVKVLRALGLEAEVARVGFEPERQVAVDWKTGRPLFITQLKGAFRDRFGAPHFQVHRADLHDILRRAFPADRLRLGATCTAVRSEADRAIVTLATGEEIEGDAIIGADGIHSKVRDELFGPMPPRFTGNVCWRALVPAKSLPSGLINPDSTIWLGPGGHTVAYYVRNGELVNYVASFESREWTEESWRVEGDRAELLRTHAGWDPALRTLFERTERCYKWGLYDHEPLDRWTQDRITLLGDAAHPMLPYLAQGACMAIEDGFVLADSLADTPDDVPAALLRYEASRKPRTTRVQLTSRGRARINHMRSPLARTWRNIGLKWRKWRRPESTTFDAGWIYGHDVTSPAPLRAELSGAA